MPHIRRDYKLRAYELYREYAEGAEVKLCEVVFEKIWNVLKHYVTAVIKGKDYNCSDFDFDDQLAEAQAELWQRLSDKKLPWDSPSLFVGSVSIVTQQHVIIKNHRRAQTEERSREKYVETAEVTHQPCLNSRLWAREMASDHKDVIACMMQERSRISEVDFNICRNYVELEHKNADAKEYQRVMRDSGYWDPHFLFTHLTVLYRWVYYDLNYGPEAVVA